MDIKINKENWARMLGEIVGREFYTRMKRVADACNEQAGLVDGYRVGTEGTNTLQKHDERLTVITATAEAIAYEHKHNLLLKNFHLAGGE